MFLKKHLIFLLSVYSVLHNGLYAQQNDQAMAYGCYAFLKGDTFIIGNQLIERKYKWNNGNIVSIEMADKINNVSVRFTSNIPDFYLPNEPIESNNGRLKMEGVEASAKWKEHLAVEVLFDLGRLHIKRFFRIFPNTPAIQITCFFKGLAASRWINQAVTPGELNNLEINSQGMEGMPFAPVLETIELPGNHWKVRSVQFFDITDRYNNLCKETNDLVYRSNIHTGNLAIMESLNDNLRLFLLKESPSFYSQLSYPGADFLSSARKIQMIGIGVDSSDVQGDDWVQGYGCVFGFGGFSELETLSAIRIYQKNIFPAFSDYEPVIMTNTWGDRGQDKKISEEFLKKEIESAVELGSNYLQIDDGWEAGLSANSALGGGSFEKIWDREGFWNVHSQKFPNGLEPVIDYARQSGINLSIWFNPAYKDSYEKWEKDAEILLNLYMKYGFRVIKIDGLKIEDKLSEQRVRKMFDYVYDSSLQKVSYDLDITAHKRCGYHYFNEYGVYWVANRYTDWKNYYPYTVLRNLWSLSRYVPAEKLQMPFLNIRRNPGNYADDPFAPGSVSFDYGFATVMFSQPMGFFETSGLPEEAFHLNKLLEIYTSIQKEIHAGIILPIGNEPSGRSWTGFQSITDTRSGFVLLIRELNDHNKTMIQTWLPESKKVYFTRMAGAGKNFMARPDENGEIPVRLPSKNSWVLYRYVIQAN